MNATPPIDVAAFREVTGGNPAIERDLLNEFRRSMRVDVAALRGAVARGDARQMGHIAHRMQGACCVVAARQAVAACAPFVRAARAPAQAAGAPEMAQLDQVLQQLDACVEDLLNNTETAA